MNDRAPKTMMSPGPSRRRGPMFFIVLFLIGIIGIAGGAIVVLFFVVKGVSSASITSVDATGSGSAAKPSIAIPSAVPPPPDAAHASVPPVATHLATRAATSVASPAPAAAGGCLCRALSGSPATLCPKERLGSSRCRCDSSAGGMTLCQVPWKTPDGCPTSSDFTGPAAKDGDACSGFNGGTKLDGSYSNEKLTGVLSNCSPCVIVDTYMGKIGTPCVGYRNDRAPVNGAVDCSNIEFDCKRGDATACTQLASHK